MRFKQGQTVYCIWESWDVNPPIAYIKKVFLHSQKTELPEPGIMISKMPVDYFNQRVSKHNKVFNSYRKAKSYMKLHLEGF